MRNMIQFVIFLLCAIDVFSFKLPVIKPFNLFRVSQLLDISEIPLKAFNWNISAWQRGYATCPHEVCEFLTNAKLPHDIEGTYFRNGPGKFTHGGSKEKVTHPFDGEGMVTAITIRNGKALFRNKLVKTDSIIQEDRAKKRLYRSAFSQIKGGFLSNIFKIKVKNIANTNVLYWADRLLTFYESGLPYRLEPDTLRTVGVYTYQGTLSKLDTLAAHPRIDSKNNRLVTYQFNPASNSITIYEFDNVQKLVAKRDIKLPGFSFIHDFVVTENYYIFNYAPATFDPLPFLLGFKSPSSCVKFESDKSNKLLVIPRDNSKPMELIDIDPCSNFHYVNAYEDESNSNVVVDMVWTRSLVMDAPEDQRVDDKPVWETVNFEKDVPMNRYVRYTLSKIDSITSNNDGKSWKSTKQIISNKHFDFPVVNPSVSCQKHRYAYAVTGSCQEVATPYQGIIKFDLVSGTEEIWMGQSYEFIGEPIFAKKKSTSTTSETTSTSTTTTTTTCLAMRARPSYTLCRLCPPRQRGLRPSPLPVPLTSARRCTPQSPQPTTSVWQES